MQAQHEAAARVLADRIAAWLTSHQHGWQLPRTSIIARRHGVTVGQIEQALKTVSERGLVHETADGQLYRVSPAEYLVALEGIENLGCRVDPINGPLSCLDRQAAVRPCPVQAAQALSISPGEPVCTVRATWTANDAAAATVTTFLISPRPAVTLLRYRGAEGAAETLDPMAIPAECCQGAVTSAGLRPGAVLVDLQPLSPAPARILHQPVGTAAITITVRFDDHQGRPGALTIATLRAELFRITIQTPDAPSASADADEDTSERTGESGDIPDEG